MAKYLCKKCDNCKVFRYERILKTGRSFKFLYCKENKHIVDKYMWFPETHTNGHTTYVRCTKPKEYGYNRFHTIYAEDGYIVDHINKIGVDNRLSNLRLLTHRENSDNRTDNTKYPGVFKEGKKWIAKIKVNGKYYRICRVNTPEEAYKRRQKAKKRIMKKVKK